MTLKEDISMKLQLETESIAEQLQNRHAQLHLNVFIVSASGGQKPQFWANFDIWGAPIPTHFYL